MSNNNDPMGLGGILGCAIAAFVIFGILIGVVISLGFQAVMR